MLTKDTRNSIFLNPTHLTLICIQNAIISITVNSKVNLKKKAFENQFHHEYINDRL